MPARACRMRRATKAFPLIVAGNAGAAGRSDAETSRRCRVITPNGVETAVRPESASRFEGTSRVLSAERLLNERAIMFATRTLARLL